MHALASGVPFSTQINLVQPLLLGIFNGAAYGLLGLGLVLLYKSNRIFNFAQGEFATVAAIVMVMFVTGDGFLPKLPYGVAMVLGVLASVLVAMGTERVVIRPMFDRARIVLVVATVGVALLLIGVESFVYYQGQNLPSLDEALKLTAPPLTADQIPIPVSNLTK